MKTKRPSLFRDIDPKVKPVQGIGGLLSKALRQIMFQRSGKNYHSVLRRIDEFVADTRKGNVSNAVASYWNRSNLRRELWQPSMTWKNFFKGLFTMRAASIEIHFYVKYDDPPLNEKGEVDHAKLAEMEKPVIIKANLKGADIFLELRDDIGEHPENWSKQTATSLVVAGDGDEIVQDIPETDK